MSGSKELKNKSELIKLINDLKIYRRDKNEIKRIVEQLRSLIKENSVLIDNLGEVLSGFILERCDNMLANTPLEDRARDIVHEISKEAYKLYVYFVLKQLLLSKELFIKYVLEFDKKTVLEAQNLEELKRQVNQQILGSVKKDLDENGYKLLSNIIITDEKQLDELLPILKKALETRTIVLKIVPNHNIAVLPLFFKEYYLPKNNREKTWLIAVALDKIVKNLEQYFKQDKTVYEHIKTLEKYIRRLLGAYPLDEFESQQSTKSKIITQNINNYLIEGKRTGGYFCLKIINNNSVICQCNDWPSFQKCIKKLELPSEISIHNKPELWNCISNKIYEILFKARQISVHLVTLINECKDRINNYQTYISHEEPGVLTKTSDDLINKLYKLINDVLDKKSIETLEINGYKIVAKPSTMSYPVNIGGQTIVLDVHRKENGIIEITIDDRVYQVYRDAYKDGLKNIIREIFGKTIFKNH